MRLEIYFEPFLFLFMTSAKSEKQALKPPLRNWLIAMDSLDGADNKSVGHARGC